MKYFLIISLLVGLGGLLLINFAYLPDDMLIVDNISKYYVKSGLRETGALNLVTSILYDYRGFDSLGESTVIFAAVSGIVLILSRKRLPVSSHGLTIIVKRTFGFLTPFIFLFALYIMLHGHLSPGGGFQGGVILASISIIFSIVYGSAFDYNRYSLQSKTILETGGALLFLLIGVIGIFSEGAFLANLVFIGGKTGGLLSAGSLPLINIGVGFKVGAGFAIIFYSMIQKNIRKE